jgi:radical SAM protein with 4Fe4S-binding SPASM domain
LDRFLELFRAARQDEQLPIRLLVDHGIGPWPADGCFACVAGERVAYLTASGELYPCPGLLFPPFAVGRVDETPLAELLASPRMDEIRTLARGTLGEPCGSCTVVGCSGGCRGAAYAATGSPSAAPQYCAQRRR